MGSQMSQMQSRLGTAASSAVGSKSKSKARQTPQGLPRTKRKGDGAQGGDSARTSEEQDGDEGGYGEDSYADNGWTPRPTPRPVSPFRIYRYTTRDGRCYLAILLIISLIILTYR
jgi:hypothetical protein